MTCDPRGQPQAVLLDGGWTAVAQVADEWRVATGWWRTPVRRRYFQLLLANDHPLTIFEDRQDASAERWYRQQYPVQG